MVKEHVSHLTPKSFLHKILNGTAIAVIVCLLPNSIFSILLSQSFFQASPFFATWNVANVLFQSCLAPVIGLLVAFEFNLKGMKAALLPAIAFVSSGAASKLANASQLLTFVQENKAPADIITAATKISSGFYTSGTGDIINVMVICAISVLIIIALEGQFASFNFVLLPILGTLIATLGLFTLPYVKLVTTFIGQVILYFVDLTFLNVRFLLC